MPLWRLQLVQLQIYFLLSLLICEKTRSRLVTARPVWFRSGPTACLSTGTWMDLFEGSLLLIHPCTISHRTFLSRAQFRRQPGKGTQFCCNRKGNEIRGYFNKCLIFGYLNVFSWGSLVFAFIRLLSCKRRRSLITKNVLIITVGLRRWQRAGLRSESARLHKGHQCVY